MTTTSSRATENILNGLIVACHDGMRAQSAMARVLAGARQHEIEDSVRRRAVFTEELGKLVHELGGTPSASGSVVERFRESFEDARSVVGGEHAGDRCSICVRVDGKTEELYERALQGRLPDAVRVVVERQHTAIAAERAELRRRRIF